jgi:hypothetical protein
MKYYTIEEFVKHFADNGNEQTLWDMIEQYEKFEKHFYIDDCLLVSNARLVSKQLYGGSGNETLVSIINKLALEIYKHFALKYKEIEK